MTVIIGAANCARTRHVQYIFISARSGDMDQVFALENGGDDFITKPFHYEIVLAKIRSHLRRSFGEYASGQSERTIKLGALNLFIERMELHVDEEIVPLQKKECVILELLLDASPKVFHAKSYSSNYGTINHLSMKIR